MPNLDPVLAATPWKSNAHLIEDVARLGYLNKTDKILDPTYGKGNWWKRWRPDAPMLCFSTDPESEHYTTDFDFRSMPYLADGMFDAVAYDPPYVAKGGRKPNQMTPMNQAYGLVDAPATPTLLQMLINDGMDECARALRPARGRKSDGGILLVKCCNYVSSGEVYPGRYNTYDHATKVLGLVFVDELHHLTTPRPQDESRKQAHARSNVSTLLVFRKVAA